MIYLSGVIAPAAFREPRPDLGIMYQPAMGNDPAALAARPHALDNGCFAQGDRFDADKWLGWLGPLARYRDTCLFAVAPDVVGDARATLVRSAPYLPALRWLGFPAALVAQDGIGVLDVPWDTFDALFIGGSTAFKLGPEAELAAREAKRRGKWVHMGRVNSLRRLRLAESWGCDSADGTFLAFGPDKNAPRLLNWLDQLRVQRQLWEGGL